MRACTSFTDEPGAFAAFFHFIHLAFLARRSQAHRAAPLERALTNHLVAMLALVSKHIIAAIDSPHVFDTFLARTIFVETLLAMRMK